MKTLSCLLSVAAFLPLTGCAQHPTPPPAAAAARPSSLPPAIGAAVTLSEADAGKTVRIGLSEVVAFRLAVNESTGNRWFQADRLVGGVLVKKGNATYTETASGTVATVLYQGLKVGTQELHFSYAPPDARQNASRTADFRVIVH